MSDQPPCSDPEVRQFDFWLGKWSLAWGEDGKGTNTIRRILGGCVIEEQFDGTPSTPLVGMSVSTWSPQWTRWHQTWVDNQGSYLDFTGEWDDIEEKMILSRDDVAQGKHVLQRMVWYAITPDSLEWNWERSEDGGMTWEVQWNIHYRRMADS